MKAFAATLSCLITVAVASEASAQSGSWRIYTKTDPMTDRFDSSLKATVDGVLLSMACGFHPGLNREVALSVIRAPVNSESETSITYRIRFNRGEVQERTVKYNRPRGTQDPAFIQLDERDFDFIIENDIDSIALELTDSIFGRMVVEYPPIPAEANVIKNFCVGKEKMSF